MTKVSIIIPVYNTALYLKRCLESVCNQTLSDIEVICINDCSTDNSLEILKEYNVKIIDLKENHGAAFARNIGIENACGEYIGFVDSDDYIAPDFYEKLYKNSERADIVKGNILDAETQSITPFYDMNEKIQTNKSYFYYGFTSAIYKTSFLWDNEIKFPEGINYFEDPYFSIKALIYAHRIKIENNANYYYVQTSDSLSKKTDINALSKSAKLIMQELNTSGLSEENYAIIYNFLYEFIFANSAELLIEILNLCKYPKLKEHYFNNTIENVPYQMKAKFLLKRRQAVYA